MPNFFEARALKERELGSLSGRVRSLRAIAREHGEAFPNARTLAEHLKEGVVVGAFHEGDLIGLANAGACSKPGRASSGHVWIHPDYRGRGFGRKAFQEKLRVLFESGKFDEAVAYEASEGGAALLKESGFKHQPAGVLILKKADWKKA